MPSTSSLSFFSAGLALASAITVPGGSNPTAGAVYTPDSSSTVSAGQPFNITWQAQTNGCGNTVALALLYGSSPATMNAVSYIISSTDNSGSYEWTPSADLQPSDSNNKYGIELICASTQAYQYTSRFSLSNSGYVNNAQNVSSSTSSSSVSSTSSAASSSSSASAVFPSGNSTTSAAPSGASGSSSSAGGAGTSTTLVTASGTSKPESATGGSTTSPTSPSSTGAAGRVQVGLGAFVAAAAVAAALL